MRRYPKKGGQFAIIWVDLLYEDSIPATAKILFGEIYRLSGPDGWCDASNQDFMDLLGCSETTVRNLLKALEDVGQIHVRISPRRGGAGGTERHIFCGRKLAVPDAPLVPAENCGYQGGTRRNLRGVPAENCGDTYIKKSNIESIYTPPPALWDRCQKFCDGDQDLEAALLGLLESRAVRKNPLVTDRALSILLNKLARLSKGDHAVMIAMLDKSVLKNWDGVFELKPDELPASSSGQAPSREAGDVDGI